MLPWYYMYSCTRLLLVPYNGFSSVQPSRSNSTQRTKKLTGASASGTVDSRVQHLAPLASSPGELASQLLFTTHQSRPLRHAARCTYDAYPSHAPNRPSPCQADTRFESGKEILQCVIYVVAHTFEQEGLRTTRSPNRESVKSWS